MLPQIEYGALIADLGREFSAPFVNQPFYLWVATAFSLIVGTCGLPHVFVRFYTVRSEKTRPSVHRLGAVFHPAALLGVARNGGLRRRPLPTTTGATPTPQKAACPALKVT